MAGQKRHSQEVSESINDVDHLYRLVSAILDRAHAGAVRSVNHEMVLAYWRIGREIVEHVQAGSHRAAYGQQVLPEFSARLIVKYGRGYSVTNLRYFRQFYQVFSDRVPIAESLPGQNRAMGIFVNQSGEIHHTPCDESSPDVHVAQGRELSDIAGENRDLRAAIEHADATRGFLPGLSWSTTVLSQK